MTQRGSELSNLRIPTYLFFNSNFREYIAFVYAHLTFCNDKHQFEKKKSCYAYRDVFEMEYILNVNNDFLLSFCRIKY